MSWPRCWLARTTRLRSPVDVAYFRRVAVSMELRVRNIAVNSNCTACVDTDIVPCSAVSASSRHVLSANNYTAESGKCDVGFSPLPEISGISIVMYVSELFVDGKCIIGSRADETANTGVN